LSDDPEDILHEVDQYTGAAMSPVWQALPADLEHSY
jgi:hypothetical protein